MAENIVEHWVEWIVGAVIAVAIGYWVLSFFLPLDEFFSWIGGALSKKKVVVICRKCEYKNNKDAEFCSHCGEKL